MIRFILNPISGAGKKGHVIKAVKAFMDNSDIDYEITYTKEPGHATELAAEAANKEYTAVVAIGGDGSVNETSRGLVKTSTALGIIPTGSGNGFARHVGIPLKTTKALKVICDSHTVKADTARLNGNLFISTAGVGFDAHISKAFAKFRKRGFLSYIRLVAREYRHFPPKSFSLKVDDNNMHCKAMIVAIANVAQYGNGAQIAPGANCYDGLLDVVILKKVPSHSLPLMLYRLFNARLNASSDYFSTIQGKHIQIIQDDEIAQIDGEVIISGKKIEIEIDPLSLNIVVPNPDK